jgi:taurine dioxygenase
MISIEPSQGIVGATVEGVDLAKPLKRRVIGAILTALGRYSVLRFPNQDLHPVAQKNFAQRFGKIKSSAKHRVPNVPEVCLLSNIVEDGESIGYVDAGMMWHKDMTSDAVPGFTTILHAIKVPHRDGQALGDTQFVNAQAATDDLPDDVKLQLKDAIGIHSSEKYNARVRDAGSQRPSFENLPVQNPPIPHRLLIIHPVTGREILYCDPGHIVRLEGLPAGVDPDEMMKFLVAHQLQPKYQYSYSWTEGDVVMWDNLGGLHRGTLDYELDEPRLMRRSLVRGDKVFNPGFIKSTLKTVETVA